MFKPIDSNLLNTESKYGFLMKIGLQETSNIATPLLSSILMLLSENKTKNELLKLVNTFK